MNNTPFTTSPGYRVEIHGSPGRCTIKSPRGLVAIMEAGNADTREEDAARIVATVNAFPALLAALKGLEWAHSRLLSSESGGVGPEDDEKIIHAGETARAAIALAEGRTS